MFGCMDDMPAHRIGPDLETLRRSRRRFKRLIAETENAIAKSRVLLQQSRLLLDQIRADSSLRQPWRAKQRIRAANRKRKP